MVIPLAAAPIVSLIGGHAARIGITSASARAAAGTFAQSLPFGAGYSFGTYIGFPGNYSAKSSNSRASIVYLNTMPYTRTGRYYRSRYSRYGSRYGRRYGRSRYRRRYPRRYRRYY